MEGILAQQATGAALAALYMLDRMIGIRFGPNDTITTRILVGTAVVR